MEAQGQLLTNSGGPETPGGIGVAKTSSMQESLEGTVVLQFGQTLEPFVVGPPVKVGQFASNNINGLK